MDEEKKDNHYFEVSFQFDGNDYDAKDLLAMVGRAIIKGNGKGTGVVHKKNPNYDSFGNVWE